MNQEQLDILCVCLGVSDEIDPTLWGIKNAYYTIDADDVCEALVRRGLMHRSALPYDGDAWSFRYVYACTQAGRDVVKAYITDRITGDVPTPKSITR